MKYCICGLEHIGVRTVQLLNALKEPVSIITISHDEPGLEEIHASITRHVVGDARNLSILDQAGIREADVLLVLTGDQVLNIEISLAAKKINPKLRIIVSSKEKNIASDFEEGFGLWKSFFTPDYACASFLAAALGDHIKQAYELNDDYLLLIGNGIQDGKADQPLFPRKLSVISHKKLGFGEKERALSITLLKNIKKGPGSRSLNFKIPLGLPRLLLLYGVLIIVSIFVFMSLNQMSFIDALYFIITTTTTVGFGDFNLQNSSTLLKLYGCFIMLAGAGLLASLFSIVAESLVADKFSTYLGFSKKRFKNHIIVTGLGRTGSSIAASLGRFGLKTVVVEKNDRHPNIPEYKGMFPIVIGDAVDPKILSKAGVKKARTLIAAVDNDIVNINSAIEAINLNPLIRTAARIYSRALAEQSKVGFNIDQILSTSSLASLALIALSVYRSSIGAFESDGRLFLIVNFSEKETSSFENRSVRTIYQEQKIEVVAVANDSNDFRTVSDDEILTRYKNIVAIVPYQPGS